MPKATHRNRSRTGLTVPVACIVAALTVTSCEYIPFSGGALEGTVATSPAVVARQITDAAIYSDFMDGYDEKYGVRPQNENVGEIYFFELTGR